MFIPSFIVCYILAALADKCIGRGKPDGVNVVKNFVLVLFSLVFYAWGEPVYVFLMLASVLLNYVFGLFIVRNGKSSKAALAFGIACNIAILGTFKYAGFVADNLCAIGLNVPIPSIALPIGISFYTFQAISYLVDVYRRESAV